jgi:hypothetical protein
MSGNTKKIMHDKLKCPKNTLKLATTRPKTKGDATLPQPEEKLKPNLDQPNPNRILLPPSLTASN